MVGPGREANDGVGKVFIARCHAATNILDLNLGSMFINVNGKPIVTYFVRRWHRHGRNNMIYKITKNLFQSHKYQMRRQFGQFSFRKIYVRDIKIHQ